MSLRKGTKWPKWWHCKEQKVMLLQADHVGSTRERKVGLVVPPHPHPPCTPDLPYPQGGEGGRVTGDMAPPSLSCPYMRIQWGGRLCLPCTPLTRVHRRTGPLLLQCNHGMKEFQNGFGVNPSYSHLMFLGCNHGKFIWHPLLKLIDCLIFFILRAF